MVSLHLHRAHGPEHRRKRLGMAQRHRAPMVLIVVNHEVEKISDGDCTTADSFALPLCLLTDCQTGVCPGDPPPPDPCVGSAPVGVDACNAV